MKNAILKLTTILLIIVLVGCTQIYYSVSAHSDPDLSNIVKTASYAFESQAIISGADPIIEKKLFQLIDSSLVNKGWTKVSKEKAEYVFRISYSMEDRQHSYQKPVTTTYDNKGKANVSGGGGGTVTLYLRQIRINVFKMISGEEKECWFAECLSEGRTPDIIGCAKNIIPFAISRFPQEGFWNRKEIKEVFGIGIGKK